MKSLLYDLLNLKAQTKTAKYIRKFLKRNRIPFYTDVFGNIFNFDLKGVPLLSAHMDTVAEFVKIDQKKNVLTESILEDGSTEIRGTDVIGGDDKCGVYLVLRLLIENEYSFNFVFSRDEEVGCIGIQDVLTEEWNVEQIEQNCLYCLVLDRHGSSDIVCANNNYGSIEFEDDLVETSVANGFEYKPATGLFSDANFLAEILSTANLSVGYYKEHTDKESIVFEELENAYDYIKAIMFEITRKYGPAFYEYPKFTKYENYGYSGYDGFLNNDEEITEIQDDFPDWGNFPAYDNSISVSDFLELNNFLSEFDLPNNDLA